MRHPAWRQAARACAALLAASALAACGGGGGDGGGPPPSGEPVGGTPPPPGVTPAPGPLPAPPSDPTAPPAPAAVAPLGTSTVELPLRRLTASQYRNSVRDVVVQAVSTPVSPQPLSDAQARSLGDAAAALVTTAGFPEDEIINVEFTGTHGGYLRTDQRIGQRHIDQGVDVAVGVGALVSSSNTNRAAAAGSCATDNDNRNNVSCARDFIARFGRLALRRPLSTAETDAFLAVAQRDGRQPTGAAAVADVVAALLASPQFFYLVEQGQPSVVAPGGTRVPLTAHELAARLSFHFWQTIPDAELNQLADSGALLQPATLDAQLRRLAADTRTQAGVREFFSQWLRLQEAEDLDTRVGTQPFDRFRGDFTPTAQTRQRAIAEVEDMVAYLYEHDGSLQDVLTDRRSFARTRDIATLYGMPDQLWDGRSEPPPFVEASRKGLLTRVALLTSGSAATRPIIKGLRVRNALLCQPIGAPPPEAVGAVIEPVSGLSTREATERMTQSSPQCASCHASLLNPLGFVTENFDALGRTRTVERLFNARGEPAGEAAVNTTIVLQGLGTPRQVADAGEATQVILASGQLERCFSQQYFRFMFGRREAAADNGLVNDLAATAGARRPMKELLVRAAARQEFLTKDFR